VYSLSLACFYELIQCQSAADSFHNNQSIDSYIEVIGRVINPTTVQMVTSINLGTELGESDASHVPIYGCGLTERSTDMKLVNDTIELIHDPRYFGRMMS